MAAVTIYVRVNPRKSKGIFFRAGIKFTQQWQKVDVDAATSKALFAEQMLEVSKTEPAEYKAAESSEKPLDELEELLNPEASGNSLPLSETAEQADGGEAKKPSGEAEVIETEAVEAIAEEASAQAETEAVEAIAEEASAQAETEAVETVAEEAKPAAEPAGKKKPKPDSKG